jgi:Mor family transcriptional regulator
MNVQDRRFEVLCHLEEVTAAFMRTALRQGGLDESLASAAATRLRFAIAEKFGGFSYCVAVKGNTRANRISLIDAREVFAFVSSEMQSELREFGVEESSAAANGKQAGEELTAQFVGQSFYLPRQDALRLHERNQQMMAAFNGTNQLHLARDFGVGLKQVYKIIKSERTRRQSAAAVQQREQSNE